jgi:hypothetical protein
MSKYNQKMQFLRDLKEDLRDYEFSLEEDLKALMAVFQDIKFDRERIEEVRKQIEVENEELKALEYHNE